MAALAWQGYIYNICKTYKYTKLFKNGTSGLELTWWSSLNAQNTPLEGISGMDPIIYAW